MRLRRQQTARRGATLIEAAIVLMVFLTLVLGMIDLGIGVLRYNTVAQAARQGARKAIVHGKLSTAPWDAANAETEVGKEVKPLLVGVDPAEVTVGVSYLDGGNEPEQRVQVTVSAPYQPMMTFIFGNPTITVSASSTMPIAH